MQTSALLQNFKTLIYFSKLRISNKILQFEQKLSKIIHNFIIVNNKNKFLKANMEFWFSILLL
jgi:hypothetical protein